MSEKRSHEGAGLPPKVLCAFAPLSPPPGFAQSVLAAHAAAATAVAPGRTRARVVVMAGLVLIGAAAALSFAVGSEVRGATVAAQRTTVAIGGRATAVAEPGSALSFVVGRRGDAEVRQGAGEVFYRVERGGAFVVHTPVARVEVTGTCFRVEVLPMVKRAHVIGAVVGAAATAAVLVTVYEGKVRLANGSGAVVLGAGESGSASSGSPTVVAASNAERQRRSPASPVTDAEGGEELRARYHAQTQALAEARRRLAEVEDKANAKAGDDKLWFHPSKEELVRRARDCTLRWDMPAVLWHRQLPARLARSYTDSEEERSIIAETRERLADRVGATVRRLYVETTGDERSSHMLSLSAMTEEIRQKGLEGEEQRVYQRLSAERAGLAAPPGDATNQGSPYERLMRLLTTAGDDYERDLANQLGPARARALREKHNGWENKSGNSPGCPANR